MGQIGKGLDYVKSIPCILKIVEIVSFICIVQDFINSACDKIYIDAGILSELYPQKLDYKDRIKRVL
jgi:hypothetical protein